MSEIDVKAWRCDAVGAEGRVCGHQWYTFKRPEPPARCPECKSRKWNAGGVALAEPIKPVVLAKSKSWTKPENKQSRKAAAIQQAAVIVPEVKRVAGGMCVHGYGPGRTCLQCVMEGK